MWLCFIMKGKGWGNSGFYNITDSNHSLALTIEDINVSVISAPLGSTTRIEKSLGLFWLFRPSTRRYNNTLYNIFYYIQICGVRTRTELSDSLHRILSEQRPEKTCRKKTSVRKKTRQEIWVGSMAHALKSPSYEGYTAGRTLPLFTKQVFQQRTANSK